MSIHNQPSQGRAIKRVNAFPRRNQRVKITGEKPNIYVQILYGFPCLKYNHYLNNLTTHLTH